MKWNKNIVSPASNVITTSSTSVSRLPSLLEVKQEERSMNNGRERRFARVSLKITVTSLHLASDVTTSRCSNIWWLEGLFLPYTSSPTDLLTAPPSGQTDNLHLQLLTPFHTSRRGLRSFQWKVLRWNRLRLQLKKWMINVINWKSWSQLITSISKSYNFDFKDQLTLR